MIFTKPIRNLKLKGVSDISQSFGENQLSIYKQLGMKGHNGIDLVKPRGTPIFAVHDGVVMKVNDKPEDAGIYVRIMSSPTILEGREAMVETCYFHLLDVAVQPNQIIKAGTLIGHLDNTGYSTGDHLHFGIRPYWKQPNGTWLSYKDNGYFGYIDPYPYLLQAKEPMLKIIREKNRPEVYMIVNGKNIYIGNEEMFEDLKKEGLIPDWAKVEEVDEPIRIDGIIK